MPPGVAQDYRQKGAADRAAARTAGGGIGPPPPSINGANFRDLTQFTVAATAVFYLIVLHEPLRVKSRSIALSAPTNFTRVVGKSILRTLC
jgi:hypothetical protein